MGKVAVSFENGKNQVKVVGQKFEIVLSLNKSNLVIGCLDGLSRSLSKWMMAHGARNVVFLGRSGSDKSEAKGLVDGFRKQGAVAEVVRGDVGIYEDVEHAIRAAKLPVGGRDSGCYGS